MKSTTSGKDSDETNLAISSSVSYKAKSHYNAYELKLLTPYSFGKKSLAIIKDLDRDDTLSFESIFCANSLVTSDAKRNVIKV